jgi:hypothetical protein
LLLRYQLTDLRLALAPLTMPLAMENLEQARTIMIQR